MVKTEMELLDYCTCTKWDFESESEVLDEDGNPVPADWCMGCFDDALSINGDFRLVFTYEDGEMSAVRYSHDEPTGTGKFEFRLATDDELEAWDYR
jgi:hypothetical protein